MSNEMKFTNVTSKVYEYVYETVTGIMYSLLRERNFDNVKNKLLNDRNVIAVYGRREILSKEIKVTVGGRDFCNEKYSKKEFPYTYYGGKKLTIDELEKICLEKGLNTAYLNVLKRENATNVVFFEDTGKYLKLDKLDVVI